MKRYPAVSHVVVVLALLFFVTPNAFGQTAPEYVEGEVIIKFVSTTSPGEVSAIQSSLGAVKLYRFPGIQAEHWKIEAMTVPAAIGLYENDHRVEYIEPNYLIYADQTYPNDPRFPEMWGLNNTGQTGGTPDADIDAPEGWDFETGEDVLVGVIDTGTDWHHVDLADNIYINPGEIPNNGIDDDGNGFVDDVRGWDFVNNDNDPFDDAGHGTHVSGTVAAIGNNGVGVVGVSWTAKILPIKFLSASGGGTTTNAIKSVEYATMMNVRLTNNSWGGGGFSVALKDAIEDAGDNGQLFVAAAGNGSSDTDIYPHYPSSYDLDNIISVANTTHSDLLSGLSNWGLTTVDLGAPGTSILSTFPGNSYGSISGTSMASPHVAGAVSLLWSAAPTMPHLEVKQTIMDYVDPIPALLGRTVTGGRLNIFNFLSTLDSIPPAKVTDLAVASTSSNTATLTWTATGNDSTEGTAARYDIRVSTSQIYWSNFDAATPVPNSIEPQPAGSPESFEVWGLDFNTKYFFALKVYDWQDNVSWISNLPNGTTLGIPQLAYSPAVFSDNLPTGGTSAHILTIENVADGTLDFSFSNLPAWLSASPPTGRVESGETANVEIIFDASGLVGGSYTATFTLNTNDPTQTAVSLYANLVVTSAPDISVAPESLDFGPHYTSTTATLPLVVTNVGVIPLAVSGVTVDNPEFYANPNGFVLAPLASQTLLVEYNPVTIGTVTGTLTIASDDPDQSLHDVPLLGEGIDPPVLVVNPLAFTDTLYTGGTSSHVMTITNGGGSDLDFKITIEDVDTALAYRIDTSLRIPASDRNFPRGSAAPSIGQAPWDGVPTAPPSVAETITSAGGSSFATETQYLVFASFNLNVPEVLNTISPATQFIWAGDFGKGDNAFAYAVNDLNQFMEIDTTTGTQTVLGTLTPFGGEDFTGMALDPANGRMYLSSTNITTSSLYLVDIANVTATRIGSIGFPGIIAIAIDDQGDMYAHDLVTDELVRIDKTTGVGTAIGSLGFDANYGQGMAFDPVSGELYLAAFNNATIEGQLRIADRTTGATTLVGVLGGTTPGGINQLGWMAIPGGGAAWLAVEPNTGTVPPGTSMDVSVLYDAAGLNGGDYNANIIVSTADPVNSDVAVPAHLRVIGAPDIALSDTSFSYGQVFIGATATQTLVVDNIGTDLLQVNSITSDHSDYTVDVTSFTLNPGETQDVLVSFAPTTAAVITGTLTINSNDPDEAVLTVALDGEGADPPIISVTPGSFADSLYTGGTSSHVMTISNSGGSDLDFEITTEDADTALAYRIDTSLRIPASDRNFPRGSAAPSIGQAPWDGVPTAPPSVAETITSAGGSSFATETQYLVFASFNLNVPEVLNTISPATQFIWAGDFGKGDNAFAYAVNDLNQFMEIDTTTGTQTVLGTLTPYSGEDFTGMALDPANGRMYLSSTNITTSSLYLVDIANVTATRIGSIGFPGIIAIAIDDQGDMYAHDLVTDELVRIDKTTGVGTAIGSLGFDANYGQGMGFDSVSGELYLAAFNNATIEGQLRIADRTTGATTLVGVLGGTTPGGINQLGWMAIPGGGAAWLAVEPNTGTVPPGTSMDLSVLYDAAGLNGGDYNANIIVANNDPLSVEEIVPAYLHVTGAPDIALSDTSFSYGQVFVGGNATETLVVENAGTDLLQVNSITSDHFDYTVDVSNFDLNPGESQDVLVTFAPTTAAVITGTLTIVSNDPDEPQLDVVLDGEGLDPPIITVNPSSIADSLYTGGSSSHVLTISNDGLNDLEFDIAVAERDTAAAQQYTLTVPSTDGLASDGQPVSSLPGTRTTPITAALEDLTDVHIMWDLSHSQYGSGDWSLILSDLVARGATVTENFAPITPALLDDYDLIWLIDMFTAWTPDEIAALSDWVHGGGAVLFESDEAVNIINDLLSAMGAGFEYSMSSAANGYTTNIFPHESTEDVDSVYVGGSLASLINIVSPAGRLVDDIYDTGLAAYSEVGSGRVFAASDELFGDWAVGSADNQLFGNQLVDWLVAAVGWLAVDPAVGTVAPGTSMDVSVVFDAERLFGGDYGADLIVANNDPLSPEVTVPAALHVTGAPDIALSDTSFSYGQVFVGGNATETLVVENVGTDLLQVNSITSDHPDYTVDVSNFDLNPGESQDVLVTFAPTTAAVITGTLTIVSNDPDEPQLDVVLDGEGLDPPIITVNPSSIADSLYTGGSSSHVLTISNDGLNDLEFDIAVAERDTAAAQQYTLSIPATDGLISDGQSVDALPGTRTTPITAALEDLTDVHIMWDLSHSQSGGTANWSVILSDLEARGATVTENFAPITPALLDNYDLVWLVDMYGAWTPDEIAALSDWVHGGGALLFESDQAVSIVNELLAAMGTGVVLSTVSATNGLTTDITPHETTTNVNSVNVAGALASLASVVPPGGVLVNDIGGIGVAAFSDVQSGRVFAASDELFGDWAVGSADNQLFGNQVVDWLVAAVGWLAVEPASGTVAPGMSADVSVLFDAERLFGGDYGADLVVANNDPLSPEVTVPADLHVTGAPDIAVSDSSLSYGQVYIGATVTDTLVVENGGTDLLAVSSLTTDHTDFTVDLASFDLNPGESQDVLVTFAPSTATVITGTLTINSNDPDEPVVTVALDGEGIEPPIISVTPGSLADSLYTGETSIHVLTIGNDGASDLNWEISVQTGENDSTLLASPAFDSTPARDPDKDGLTGSPPVTVPEDVYQFASVGVPAPDAAAPAGQEAQYLTPLEDILSNLDAGYGGVTAIIPNRYDFSEGETGFSISDGGNDMYDGGNMLSTNLGGNLEYMNGIITTSPYFGPSGRYFTRKYAGLFVMVADMEGVGHFQISGNLGADGGGSADGAVLQMTVAGTDYFGFVKRVYNAGDPSVNHLIIVETDPAVTHEFATYTDDDYHRMFNATGVRRVYYLLYAGSSGFYIDNTATLAIMDAFLSTIGLGPGWVQATPSSGTVAPDGSVDVDVLFDAEGLLGGDYSANLVVLNNDPLSPEVSVPANMHVTGAPDIAVSDTSFSYGQIYIGATVTDTLVVENGGTDLLAVSSLTTDHTDFTVDLASFDLNPGESQDVLVSFSPTTAAVIAGTLTINSDDPDEPVVTVALDGEGLVPPAIAVSPDSLVDSLFTGDVVTHQLTIDNTGGSDLVWEIRTASADASLLYTQYTLSVPQTDDLKSDGQDVEALPGTRTTPISAALKDLTGVNIMWDLSHGQGGSTGWSTIITDVTMRGATVTENFAPITPALLEDIDMVWLIDMAAWSPAEIAAISAWVHAGGSVLFESDQAETAVNQLLTAMGAGIVYSTVSATNGLTTDIIPHETTTDVNNVNVAGALASLASVVSPAGLLVNDVAGVGVTAFSEVQSGRVVAATDELFGNYAIGSGDNQLFGNQAVDWLVGGIAWLEVSPSEGTTPAGATDVVDVVFDASTILPGYYEAVIEIANNDPLAPIVSIPATLDVTGASNIVVSDTVFDFGPVIIGATVTAPLTVSNTGNDDLVVSDVSSDNADFSALPAAFTMPPGGSQVVSVSYVPTVDGPVVGTLTITSNDPDEGQLPIALLGEGLIPPQIAVSPDSLSDHLLSGQMSMHTLTIANAGGSDLVFTIQTTETTAPADTSQDPAAVSWLTLSQNGGTIPAGGNLDVSVTFDATVLFGGDYSADIRFASNIPGHPGIVVPATLGVTGVPNIAVSDTLLDFGTVYLGYPETMNFLVSNTGTDVLTVSDVASDEPVFTATPTAFQVPYGSHQLVEVTFDPTTVGPASATLTISSDDPDQASVPVALLGEALDPPVVNASVDSLEINVPIGQTVVETFMLENTGGSDLEWAIEAGFMATAPLQMVSALSGQSIAQSETPQKGEDEVQKSAATLMDVLWHGDHGLGGIGLWSTIIADITARGANVTESSDPITTTLLSDVDILWFGDRTTSFTQGETDALIAWVNDGGKILVEADSDGAAVAYSELFYVLQAGLGIYMVDGFPGITESIHPHPTTSGVSTLYLLSPGAYVGSLAPGGPLFDDLLGSPMGAYSEVGDGRIVVITDQIFHDVVIGNADNRLFANQVFTWLAVGGFDWLSITPATGTLSAGTDVEVSVEVDASILPMGSYDLVLEVMSNDPARPIVSIPTRVIVDSTVTVTGVDDDRVPAEYALLPNYPNPFNPTTTIRYNLRAPVNVQLVIYNVRGEKVIELVNENRPAGRHQVVWDGRNAQGESVATGVYLYRIIAGEFVSTRKMTLLK